MDRKAMMEAMTTSISEVLETMFFMPVDVTSPENDGADLPPVAEGICAKLDFTGPAQGSVMLQVPAPLAIEISADFMGVDPALVTPQQRTETVAEMVNMLTGNTLSVYDPHAVFDLGVPFVLASDQNYSRALDQGSHICLILNTMDNRMVMTVAWRE